MRRPLRWPALAAAALAVAAPVSGCRAAIGYEDLTLADGGAATGSDASVGDAAVRDGSTPPPGNDGGPPPGDGGDLQQCAATCHQTNPKEQFDQLLGFAKSNGCICGVGTCGQECVTTTCAVTSTPAMDECAKCIDRQLGRRSKACDDAVDACVSAACAPLAACLKACK